MIDLLDEFRVDYVTEGSHHCSPGWIQINCPHCHDSGYHLGYNIDSDFFNCYRCGWHNVTETMSLLLDKSVGQTISIMKEFKLSHRITKQKKEVITKTTIKSIELPSNAKPITPAHRAYLTKRDFDSDKIESLYRIKGTKQYGKIKYRIIIPVYQNGILTSWQARDITDKSKSKYLNCKKDNEGYPMQHSLYGLDHVMSDSVVVVEGVMDVWRLGVNAVAVFGTNHSKAQIATLAHRFKRVAVLFDSEPKAQAKAYTLSATLQGAGVESEIITLTSANDPCDLDRESARDLMFDLVRNN